MPRTKSILFENDGPELKDLSRYDCCQFLHHTTKNWGALVPLKYAFNHKDITKKYIEWLDFLNDKFQIKTSYSIVEKEVAGLLTYNEFLKFSKEHQGKYSLVSRYMDKHAGVNARRASYQPYIHNEKIYMNVYGGDPNGILRITGNGTHFVNNKKLPVKLVPFMDVRMPIVHEKEYNNLKYLYWYIIRFFSEYPQFAFFMMDRQNELEKLIKKKSMHWYNILIGITDIYGLNTFAYDIRTINVNLDVIKEALNTYIETHYNNEYHYNRDEINFCHAIRAYLNTPKYQPPTELSLSVITDTTTGRMQDKDSNKLMNTLIKHLK